MKSISEFIAGKILRSETGSTVQVEHGPNHSVLGAHQGTPVSLVSKSDVGLAFYEKGMLWEAQTLLYTDLKRVHLEVTNGTTQVHIALNDGRMITAESSHEVAMIVHATLRWIGHTLLRRKLD